MTDTRIQQLKRVITQGEDPDAKAQLLAEQLRVGAKVSGEKNEAGLVWQPTKKPCASCGKTVCPCKTQRQWTCHEFPRPEADIHSMLQFRAYCGDELAQQMVWSGWNPCRCVAIPCRDDCREPKQLEVWITSLLRLAEALPDVVVSGVECGQFCTATRVCCPHGQSDYTHPCTKCGDPEHGHARGTGIITVPTKAPRYLAACAGLAVGRAMLPEWERVRVGHGLDTDPNNPSLPRIALDTIERWTWCPCPTNKAACEALTRGTDLNNPYPEWLWFVLRFVGSERTGWKCPEQTMLEHTLDGPDMIESETGRATAKLMMLKVTS